MTDVTVGSPAGGSSGVTSSTTLIVVVPVAPFPSPAVAVMVALPLAMALTKPNLFTVATLLFEDDHVTVCNVVLEGVNDVVKSYLHQELKILNLEQH